MKVCVIKDKEVWKLIYNSRGSVLYSIDCESEGDAYDKLYKEFAYQYKW